MSWLRSFMGLVLALDLTLGHAQYWAPSGIPVLMNSPTICYSDTVHDALYVSGMETIQVNGLQYFPFFRYHGGQWDTLGLFGNVAKTAIVYHDTLIVGGGFPSVQGEPICQIACYAGGDWQPYGDIGSGPYSGVVSRLRVINGDLYALGIFDTADGHYCNGLAKRVGGHWENVGVLPAFNGDGSAWFMDAVSYQGKLVVTGNFTSADGTINDVMEYDGVSWQPVCNCLNGGIDGGGSLIVYQGGLYLGGVFYYGSGNAGQGLMKWDGEDQWSMVGHPGGGLQLYDHSDAYSPTIYDFKVRDGLLLVSGGFFYADHIPASGIASWDGEHWCSLGGSIPYGITFMDFYHDSLYVGCRGPNADGQLVNGVARFIGSTYQENCAEMGIAEVARSESGLHVVSQSPGTVVLSGLSDGPHKVRIYNSEGRLVMELETHCHAGRSNNLYLGNQGSALYIIVVDTAQVAKWVPVH